MAAALWAGVACADALPSFGPELGDYLLVYPAYELTNYQTYYAVETPDFVLHWRGRWEDGLILRDKARGVQAIVPLDENGDPDLAPLRVDRARWCDTDYIVVTLQISPPRAAEILRFINLRVVVDPDTLAPVAELYDASVAQQHAVRHPQRLEPVCAGAMPLQIRP
ncbi:hypothetical protein C8N43_2144 [Litoreibacter ponti]|uniref:Uncharacterized protein n=1 Tax=Litoreibacter ponti TaxID=1510457 RepID=A0A2T6BN64_9RHOB|nr:hypothetical protein [Litoreibacter ponti]PTX57474.1 hypothetical protein C8N43_2144 [Litoreibacter ponti]